MLPPRTDPGDLVQRRGADRLCPACTMRADRKAVRLVAQSLHEVEHRVAWFEREGRTAGQKEPLASGVAVRPLGDTSDRNIVDAEFGQDAERRVQLALATVDQDQIGPGTAFALGVFLQGPAETPTQHLFHHRVVIAAGGGFRTDASGNTLTRPQAVPSGPLSPTPGEGNTGIGVFFPRRLCGDGGPAWVTRRCWR